MKFCALFHDVRLLQISGKVQHKNDDLHQNVINNNIYPTIPELEV